MDFQWILPIRPETPPSSAICSRPTRAFAARDEPHGSGKVTLALAQVMPAFASHHNRSPREKGSRYTKDQGGGSQETAVFMACHNTTVWLLFFSLLCGPPSFQRCGRRYRLSRHHGHTVYHCCHPTLAGKTRIHTHNRHAGEQTRTQMATRMMGLPYTWAHRWAHR